MIASEERKQKLKQRRRQKCRICLEHLTREVVNLGCHQFHSGCLDGYFLEEVKQRRFPIQCPEQDCQTQLPPSLIKHLEPQIQNLYMEHYLREYIRDNMDAIIFCPGRNCEYWLEYTNICPKPVFRFQRYLVCPGCFKRYCQCKDYHDCPTCRTRICLRCKQSHKGLSCQQYKWNNKAKADPDLNLFVGFLKNAQCKKCPKCRFWVEKANGCDHMVCRCGYEFCYHCNGKYKQCQCQNNPQKQVNLQHIYPKIRHVIKPFNVIQPNRQKRANTLPRNQEKRKLGRPLQPLWSLQMKLKLKKVL